MNRKALFILIAMSMFFVVSCKKGQYVTAKAGDYGRLEEKIDLLEKQQKEILLQLRNLNLKGRAYSRFVKSTLKDKNDELVKIGKLRKEVRKIRINNADFARIVNKLIDLNVRQKVDITRLKRKFYRLWAIAKKNGDVPMVAAKRRSVVEKKAADRTPVVEDDKTRRQKNRMLKVLEGRT
ncbi:hypothetical protein ACFLQ8_00450 [Candidatus Auribacterota bacterium]